jgi:hypothetical protein
MEKSSAIRLRLALLARALVARMRPGLNRDPDPCKRRSQQEVTDCDKNGQHRPLPQCTTVAYVRRLALRHKLRTPIIAPKTEVHVTFSRRLTLRRNAICSHEMLQHNGTRAGNRAHIAHAAMVSLHALCCGLPALAMIAAAVSGAATGISLLADFMRPFHELMHAHEIWILVVSAVLVATGGVFEGLARRGARRQAFPWLYALSVCCFVANVAIIAAHRALG